MVNGKNRICVKHVTKAISTHSKLCRTAFPLRSKSAAVAGVMYQVNIMNEDEPSNEPILTSAQLALISNLSVEEIEEIDSALLE